jgi:hypothetical protein
MNYLKFRRIREEKRKKQQRFKKILCSIIFIPLLVICVSVLATGTSDETAINKESSNTICTEKLATKKVKKKKNEVAESSKPKEPKETLAETEVICTEEPTEKVSIPTDINIYDVSPYASSFKSYTNYQLLSKSSTQWNQIQCHSDAYTDQNGLRKVGDYYCIAMGSYYTNTLGDIFEIHTTGGIFKGIICDWKADAHTDSTHRYTEHNGCMVEFYVDMNCLNSKAKQMGDISYINQNFNGKITKVIKLGNYLCK